MEKFASGLQDGPAANEHAEKAIPSNEIGIHLDGERSKNAWLDVKFKYLILADRGFIVFIDDEIDLDWKTTDEYDRSLKSEILYQRGLHAAILTRFIRRRLCVDGQAWGVGRVDGDVGGTVWNAFGVGMMGSGGTCRDRYGPPAVMVPVMAASMAACG